MALGRSTTRDLEVGVGMGVGAGAGGSLFCGRGGCSLFCGWVQCRVAAFCVDARSVLAVFFSTISHCPWRDFIFTSRALALGCSLFCGRVSCRVAAFCVDARSVLAVFFSTISHCPWRDFISLSNGDKETEAKKTPFQRGPLSVPSAQVLAFGTQIARCSPEPPMPETRFLRPLTRTRFASSALGQNQLPPKPERPPCWLASCAVR
jgi:hypothetical protein